MTILPRGLRNDNPGNIRKGGAAWPGEIEGHDPDFVTFAGPAWGIRAIAEILLGYARRHYLMTPMGVIGRWAAPGENAARAFAEDVARRLGVRPDRPLAVDHPEILKALVAAVIHHENGQMPYPDHVLAEGVAMALDQPLAMAA